MKEISKITKSYICSCGETSKFEFETDMDISQMNISVRCQNCGREAAISLDSLFRRNGFLNPASSVDSPNTTNTSQIGSGFDMFDPPSTTPTPSYSSSSDDRSSSSSYSDNPTESYPDYSSQSDSPSYDMAQLSDIVNLDSSTFDQDNGSDLEKSNSGGYVDFFGNEIGAPRSSTTRDTQPNNIKKTYPEIEEDEEEKDLLSEMDDSEEEISKEERDAFADLFGGV